MEQKNQSEIEFGQCRSCRSVRWLSDAAAKEYGTACLHCGDRAWKPFSSSRWYGLSPVQRLQTLSWVIWEHYYQNGKDWRFFTSPFRLARVLRYGLCPPVRKMEGAV